MCRTGDKCSDICRFAGEVKVKGFSDDEIPPGETCVEEHWADP